MPCNLENNNIGVAGIPQPSLPGIGIPFAPITVSAPGFDLPEGIPESILDLISNLSVNWPGFLQVSPNLDNLANNVLTALSSLFNQIAPFLGLYNFFIALLNIVLCIIEVLCALPNPYSTIRAVIRLIKTCLPQFLNLFPWIALLAMILSLLLLLLALISYIIARILAFIEDLLRNINVLVEGLSFSDAEATAAAIFKIGSLLCLIENLVSILGGLAAIIAIIETLANIAGRTVCSGGRGQGNDSQCCTDDVCPPFIIENPDGIVGSKGKLVYHKPVRNTTFLPGFDFSAREERWQFYNDDIEQEVNSQFRQIITSQKGPSNFYGFNDDFLYGDIFWPESQVFEKDSTLRRTPYVVDLLLENYDPGIFISSDDLGERDFIIRNTIVHIKPYIGITQYNNSRTVPDFDGYTIANNTGTLRLVGGTVYEIDSDGYEHEYLINGNAASLENFISQNTVATIPDNDDTVTIPNITFNLKINHAALVYYDLIVYGCIPSIRQEVDIANIVNGDVSALIERVGSVFPDVNKTVNCLNQSVSKLRSDISFDSVQNFQSDSLTCLDELREETENIYCKIFLESVDPFQSDFTLNPDVQFINSIIEVQINLRDRNGIVITNSMPDGCAESVAEKLKVNATFGKVSEVEYVDEKFIAKIESDQGGTGEVTVSFQDNILSRKLNSDTLEQPTSIENLVKEYNFVGIRARSSQVTEPDDVPFRDSGDVSRGE